MAGDRNLGSASYDIDANTAPVHEKMAAVREDVGKTMDNVGRQRAEASVDIDLKEFLAKREEIDSELRKISRAKATATAELDTKLFDARAAQLIAEKKELERKIDIPVHMDRSAIASGANELRKLNKDLDDGRSSAERWFQSISKLRLSIGPFSGTLRQFGIAFTVLGPVLTSAIGLVGALAGVLTTGLAGGLAVGSAGLAGFALAAAGTVFALKPVVTEVKAAFAASTAYNAAVLKYGKGSSQAATASANLANTLKGISPAARAAIKDYGSLRDEFNKRTGSVRTDAFSTVAQGIKTAKALLPTFATETARTFHAASQGVSEWLKGLRSPEAKTALADIMRNFDQSLPSVLHGLGSIGATLGRISASASKLLPGLTSGFDTWASKIEAAVGSGASLDATIARLVGDMQDLGHLTQSTGSLLVTVLDGGSKSGDDLVRSLTGVENRWNSFLKTTAGQNALSKFFSTSATEASHFITLLAGAVGLFYNISQATQPFSSALISITGDIAKVVNALMRIPVLNQALGATATALAGVFVANKVLDFAQGIQKAIIRVAGLGAAEDAQAASADVAAASNTAEAASAGEAALADTALAEAAGTAAVANEALALSQAEVDAAMLGGIPAATRWVRPVEEAAGAAGGLEVAAGGAAESATALGAGAEKVAGSVEKVGAEAGDAVEGVTGLRGAAGEVVDVLAAADPEVTALVVGFAAAGYGAVKLGQALKGPSDAVRQQVTWWKKFNSETKIFQAATSGAGLKPIGDGPLFISGKQLKDQAAAMQNYVNGLHNASKNATTLGGILHKIKPNIASVAENMAQTGKIDLSDVSKTAHSLQQYISSLSDGLTQLTHQRDQLTGSGPGTAQFTSFLKQLHNAGTQGPIQPTIKPPKIPTGGFLAGGGNIKNPIISPTVKTPRPVTAKVTTKFTQSGQEDVMKKIQQILGIHFNPKVQKISHQGGNNVMAILSQIQGLHQLGTAKKTIIANKSPFDAAIAQLAQIILPPITQPIVAKKVGGGFSGGSWAQGGPLPMASGGPTDKQLQQAAERASRFPTRDMQQGARVTRPTFLTGEEPGHHEYVIATNPAYRSANTNYLADAAMDLGFSLIPAYKKGKKPKNKGAGIGPNLDDLTDPSSDYQKAEDRITYDSGIVDLLKRQYDNNQQNGVDLPRLIAGINQEIRDYTTGTPKLPGLVTIIGRMLNSPATQGVNVPGVPKKSKTNKQRKAQAAAQIKHDAAVDHNTAIKSNYEQLTEELKEIDNITLPGLNLDVLDAENADAQNTILGSSTAYQARYDLFKQSASNIGAVGGGLTAGGTPAGSPYIVGSGSSSPGASAAYISGGSNGGSGISPITSAGGSGGTVVTLVNNFATTPSDPHTWSQGVAYELGAAI